jgi:hypothetical protein
MNIGRELGDWKVLRVLAIDLLELPIGVNWNDGSDDHAGQMFSL